MKLNKATLKSKIEEHAAESLTRDERVQRALKEGAVNKLRSHLNLDAIGTIVVSRRANGDLIVLDGGHRVTALIEEDFGEWLVRCIVYSDLTLEQEAELFLLYNDRRVVSLYERFRVGVTAQDPESVILDREVHSAGFTIGIGNKNALLCISSLQDIYRGGVNGAKANITEVREMLRIIGEAWGTEGSALKEAVLGVGGVLLAHNGATDTAHLIKILQVLPGGPNAIRARARYHRENTGRPIRETSVIAVREAYNKKLAPSKKLAA